MAEQARIRVSRAGYQKYFSRAGVGKLPTKLSPPRRDTSTSTSRTGRLPREGFSSRTVRQSAPQGSATRPTPAGLLGLISTRNRTGFEPEYDP
mgnify:CR=1 FL=1